MQKNSPQKPLNGKTRQHKLVDKLLARAAQLPYGTISCRLTVHKGEVQHVDIEGVTERLKAE